MRALIREDPDGTIEVYPETDWTEWTRKNLDREIEINGWTLVDPWDTYGRSSGKVIDKG